MQELIPINILIGDRTYRIKVLPNDEETVRKQVKIINDKVIEFKTHFAGKDMQDYVAMVLIWFATQAASSQNELSGDMLTKLNALEEDIDEALRM